MMPYGSLPIEPVFITCPKCGAWVHRADLKRHVKTHKETP